MKRLLMNFAKYQKWIYVCYYYIGSFFLRILKYFVKTDDKLILFSCFGGMKYDDSPKAIYEEMSGDRRFSEYRFVWAFHNPEKFDIVGVNKVKTDTLRYYITALKARVWITNSGMERGLNFKGKHTLYCNTWHGTPIKKMGDDRVSENKSFAIKSKMNVDLLTVQSDFEAEIFSKMFEIPMNGILKVGLPRNDRLTNYTEADKKRICQKLGISENKKIILYAPTFREYERDKVNNCVLNPPMNLEKWKKELGDYYCILFRTHYEVAKTMNIDDDDFVRNMSQYSDLSELMIISDILISDYSSIFFDFSIMDKVMLHFAYDYDKYEKERGMYFDIRSYLSGSDSEDELLNIIKNADKEVERKKNVVFRNEYVNYFGNATKKTVEFIFNRLSDD